MRAEEVQRVRAEEVQRVRAEEVRVDPGQLPDVEVARVRPQDWPALRSLRLEALQDSPVAYCERYATALVATDEVWQVCAARGAEGGDSFQLLAWERDLPVATCVGFRDGDDAVLAAVYVTPSRRGRGLLDAMVGQVADWARQQDAVRLRLLVHETNDVARRAYERLGFAPTGYREPYPLDPSADELELARPLRQPERDG